MGGDQNTSLFEQSKIVLDEEVENFSFIQIPSIRKPEPEIALELEEKEPVSLQLAKEQQQARDKILDEASELCEQFQMTEKLTLKASDSIRLEINEEIERLKNEGNKKRVVFLMRRIGTKLMNLKIYDEALRFFQLGVKIAATKKSKGVYYNEMGVLFMHYGGQYGKSLECFGMSLLNKSEIGDKVGVGVTLNNIGNVHCALEEYEESIKFYEKSLRIRSGCGDVKGSGQSLGNIALVYFLQRKYKMSMKFFEKSLKIKRETKDRNGEAEILRYLAVLHEKLDNQSESLQYFQKAKIIERS